jgi:hypothetical protein
MKNETSKLIIKDPYLGGDDVNPQIRKIYKKTAVMKVEVFDCK